MFRLVQFVNTLTTSYWYVSGAHYKIQNVSIFSPRSIYQAFQEFLWTHSLLLHSGCLFIVTTIVITKHMKLWPHPLCGRIWYVIVSTKIGKKPLKSSFKATWCPKNWKILKPCKRNWAYTDCWMAHEGVDINWDFSPVSSPVSKLNHRGQ